MSKKYLCSPNKILMRQPRLLQKVESDETTISVGVGPFRHCNCMRFQSKACLRVLKGVSEFQSFSISQKFKYCAFEIILWLFDSRRGRSLCLESFQNLCHFNTKRKKFKKKKKKEKKYFTHC